jgi:2-polyprenyl-3-methyl-5-hydroxy-6-metoxy-1,4-benzoquinol methylase
MTARPASDLERAACPLCAADAPERKTYVRGEFAVVRCGGCRLWYLSPRLREEDMRAAYADAGYFEGGTSGYVAYASQQRSLLATFGRLLMELKRHGVQGRSVLDVGCGYGYFLQAASSAFEFRVGTDLSAAAADRARAHASAVYVGGPDALPPGTAFDCVVALHVVEHVYRPREFFTALLDRVNPRGWLVLATPDMGSGWRKLMGRNWPSFKVPEHVAFYDRHTLRALVDAGPGVHRILDIPYPHAFPLAEVCAKLGFRAPRVLAGKSVWIPGTTVCVAIQRR